jgi:hypothetical protein
MERILKGEPLQRIPGRPDRHYTQCRHCKAWIEDKVQIWGESAHYLGSAKHSPFQCLIRILKGKKEERIHQLTAHDCGEGVKL